MRRPLVLLSLLLLTACSSLPASEPPAWRLWSAAHGGVLDPGDAASARARTALARLADADATVRVLAEADPAAYAFRDGSIFVTRGLVALLSDDELAAALAHELGHLTGRGDGLPGPEAELLADRLGGEVLHASGLPPGLVLDMLRKLDRGDARIAARIAALEAPLELLAAAE